MKISGVLTHNGYLDHNLVITYSGSDFSVSDASLHYNFNMTGSTKNINLIFMSDHKRFSDIRFGISFDILEGQSGVSLDHSKC